MEKSYVIKLEKSLQVKNIGFLRYSVNKKLMLTFIMIVLFSVSAVNAATRTASVSGAWSSTATWGGAAVPTAADDVIINSAITVTISAAAVCNNFTNNGTLTISGTNTLTVSGNWTNSGAFNSGTSTVIYDGANQSLTGNTSFWFVRFNGTGTKTLSSGFTYQTLRTTDANVSPPITADMIVGSGATLSLPTGANWITKNHFGFQIAGTLSITGGNFLCERSFNSNNPDSWLPGSVFNISSGILHSGTTAAGDANFGDATVNLSGTGVIDIPDDIWSTGTLNQSGGTINNSTGGGCFGLAGGNLTGGTINAYQYNSSDGMRGLNVSGATTATNGHTTNIVGSLSAYTPKISNASAQLGNVFFIVGSTLQYTAGAYLSVRGNLTISGVTLIANNNSFAVGGNWNNNGTFTPGTNTVTLNGSSLQAIGGSNVTTFNGLTVNNPAGATLSIPEFVGSSGVLTLINGPLNTTATNILTILNPASGAATGGSAASYVNGPLKWSLAGGNSYCFPVGKGVNYYPFYVAPTGTTPQLLVESFNVGCGGSPDATTIMAISNTEYWKASVVSGSITNAVVGLGRTIPVSPYNVIARSASMAGIYSTLCGTPTTNEIINSNGTGSTLDYFVMAQCNAPIGGSVSGPNSVCDGATGVQYTYSGGNPATTAWSWTVTGGTITSGSTANTITVNWGSVGAGQVTCTPSCMPGGASCSCYGPTFVYPVTINPFPVVTASASPAVVCSGQSSSLSASGASTYTWNTGATGSPVIVNPTTSTTYTVTGTSAAGCSSTASVSVTVNPSPLVTASASPAVICSGQTTSLSAGGATTYTWNTGATGSPVTVNPTTSTTYTVTGSSVGCSGTASVTVTVNPLPTVTVSASPAAICTGQSSSLSAGGASTYTWNTGATGSPVTVNPTTSTTYSVTGTSAAGCSSTASVSVTVNPSPLVTASASPAVICSGQTTSLSAGGASTYTWNTGATGSPVTVSPTTSTTYTVTGTSAAGCTSTASVNVTVNQLPVVTVSASPAAICPGQSSSLSASGASTYTWNTGATGSPVTVNPIISTTYTVTGSTAGCTATASVTVTVNPIPTVTASASPAAICTGQSSSLSAGGASTYTWNTGATGSPVTVSPTISTTYTVTGTSAAGCSSTASVSVTVNPSPLVTASASPAAICPGQSTSLTAGGASTYTWDTGVTGSPVTVNPTTSTIYTVTGTSSAGCTSTTSVNVTVNQLPTVTASASPAAICPGQSSSLSAGGATTYTWNTGATGSPVTVIPSASATYTVTGTSAEGCSATASVDVTVNPLPVVTASASPATICSGQSSSLAAMGTTTYTWNTGETTPNITVNPTTTTTYTVTGVSGGCTATASVMVTVEPFSDIVTITTNASCNLDNGTASVVNVLPGYTYVWSTVPPQNTQTATGLAPGTYSVTVSNNGCSGTASVSILEEPLPDASFYFRPEYIVIDESMVSFYDQSFGNIASWNWDFGDGSVGTGKEINHEYADTGSYLVTLVIVDANGCSDTAREYICVYPSFAFWIPNSFTPNDDDRNEVFLPVGVGVDSKNYFMIIYDKWGGEMFYTTDINEGWKGTLQNKKDYTDCVQGTYVYLINVMDLRGKIYTYKGIVTLVQ